MLKRKIISKIEEWTKTKNRKCLVIQGARQVGKTFAVEHFAQNHYKELVEINCELLGNKLPSFLLHSPLPDYTIECKQILHNVHKRLV